MSEAQTIEEAAKALYASLGMSPFQGVVGTGSDTIHMYTYKKWHGEKPTEYMGFPVVWHVTGVFKPQ